MTGESTRSNKMLKLQLTADALDKLLGGDVDAVVDLRQTVVEEFARKHIKAVANDVMVKVATDAARTIATAHKNEVEAFIYQNGPPSGRWTAPVYTDEFKNAVHDSAKRLLLDAVQPTVYALADELRKENQEKLNSMQTRVSALIADAQKQVDGMVNALRTVLEQIEDENLRKMVLKALV